MWISLIKNILNTLFPKSCIICGDLVEDICTVCLNSLKRSNETASPIMRAFLNYKDYRVKKIMYYIKYYHHPYLSYRLIDKALLDIQIFLNSNNMEDTLIIPIPADKWRFLERGYNQSAVISEYLTTKLNEDKLNQRNSAKHADILIRTRHAKKLSHLSGGEYARAEAVHNIYKLKEDFDMSMIKDKDVLLIDDITTTGSTLYEAKRLLENLGARKVIGYSLAH